MTRYSVDGACCPGSGRRQITEVAGVAGVDSLVEWGWQASHSDALLSSCERLRFTSHMGTSSRSKEANLWRDSVLAKPDAALGPCNNDPQTRDQSYTLSV